MMEQGHEGGGKVCSSCGSGSCGGCGGCGVKGCGCMCHKALPVLVILLGIAALGVPLGWWMMETFSYVWPVILILGGLNMLMKGKCKCC